MKRSILLLRMLLGSIATAVALFVPFLLARFIETRWGVHVPGLATYAAALACAIGTFHAIVGRHLWARDHATVDARDRKAQ